MANPNTIPYYRYQDIQIPDVELKAQFDQYITQGNYQQALNLLADNSEQLEQGKAYVADAINRLTEGLVTLETEYFNNTTVFLSNLTTQYQTLIDNFRKRSTWTSTGVYLQNNFVIYNSRIYYALSDVPQGTVPTNTTYWLNLGLQGEQGAAGLNVVMRYNWNSNSVYQVNDLVVYDGIIYVALQQNNNSIPSENPDDWLVFLTLNAAQIYVNDVAPSAYVNDTIWFQTAIDPAEATGTDPIIGQFKRYSDSLGDWENMYPNTLVTLVENASQYDFALVTEEITIEPNDWVDGVWTYNYPKLSEDSIVDILPNAEFNTLQATIYNNLTISVDSVNIILTSAIIPQVDLPIKLQIS